MEPIVQPDPLQHEELEVPASLKPFVARHMRTWTDEAIDFVMPLPPTGSLFLTLVFGDRMTVEFTPGDPQPVPDLFIGGQLRNTMPVSRVRGRIGITGCEFMPTGFYRLFHQNCETFTDAARPFTSAFPESGEKLLRTLAETPDISGKQALLQSFLMARLPHALPATVVDEAVDRIERAHGAITVAEIARQSHLSERQLNRRFLKEVGVGPKHFAKVVQIKQAIFTLQSGNPGELQELAQQAGYFDQSHFINDFQRLIGTNPLSFLEAGSSFLRTYMKKRA